MPARRKRKANAEDMPDREEATKKRANDAQQAKLRSLLESFDGEVQDRVRKLHKDSEKLLMAMRNALGVEIMKLPKKVREMKMKQFMETYGGNFDSAKKNQPCVSNVADRKDTTAASAASSTQMQFTVKVAGKDVNLFSDLSKAEKMQEIELLKQQLAAMSDEIQKS